MTQTINPEVASEQLAIAKQLRLRSDLTALDASRHVLNAAAAGATQALIARAVGITQSAVSKMAARTTTPLPGFSGATPMEIIERYAAGLIAREQLLEELERYPWQDSDPADADGLRVDGVHALSTLTAAQTAELIDLDTYELLIERLARVSRSS